MKENYRPCAVIPVYNHGSTVRAVVNSLKPYGLSAVLVDDGSDRETAEELEKTARDIEGCHLFTLPQNQGKGGAVMKGLLEAENLGFTHALQVDADGQHDVSDVEKFLNLSRQYPDNLIAGYPVYDETVPTARKVGRKLTTFMVHLETLSRDIVDAMCGFRLYPLAESCRLIRKASLGKRMEFDIQYLVKLHWKGMSMRFLPVRVIYPEGGISHFRMFRDNAMISKMHTLLVIGMVLRSPSLLVKNHRRKKTGAAR